MTDPAARLYYLCATAQLGWSRNILPNQIKPRLRAHCEGKKTHNFALALPEHFAETGRRDDESRTTWSSSASASP